MTTGARSTRALVSRRTSAISSPPLFIRYAWLVEAALLVWGTFALIDLHSTGGDWARLALLAVLALGYEEVGKRLARVQIRLGADLTHDMTSVWGVAAALVLPLGMAPVLLASLGVYGWLRRDRPAGRPLHRSCFNVANAMLTTLITAWALGLLRDATAGLPWTLSRAVPYLVVIVAYALVNRALVTPALLALGARGKDLYGTLHDNLTEFATLCLGGLVAAALLEQPWLAILAIAPMITLQRGALVRELETAASTDAKTGLYNAITWERIAQRELTRAERTQGSTGVIIIDLDRFKLVNDRFGHLAGDQVLRGIGQRLRTEVREYDTVGRFGGEEFVAVLPTASDGDALVVAERLRSRIHDLRISDLVDGVAPENDGRLSVSIGVACSPTDGSELTDLLHSADAALYRAKALGRNRVMLADRGAGGGRDRISAR
ncbi:diguanylate cyclase [uncultured Jatrophihabitans sp.]|uniref:GGDEF domain-containing protein n=1 Tax=uncultured Jatrophihabitans sp. TaxID=1610747 RepID=UPI0035C9FA46